MIKKYYLKNYQFKLFKWDINDLTNYIRLRKVGNIICKLV